MSYINAIFCLLGFAGGMAVYAVMDWVTSVRQARAEPTWIGDSTSGMGL